MPRGRPKSAAGDSDTAKATKPQKGNGNGANLGFEAQLFLAADKLRKNLEPSDYKHVALGLIFLKYISKAFEAKRAALLAEDPTAAEDPDEYLAENVFWVPKEARWSHLQDNAKQPTIGKLIDDAMSEIEKSNPGLKGVQRTVQSIGPDYTARNVRDREVQSRPQGGSEDGPIDWTGLHSTQCPRSRSPIPASRGFRGRSNRLDRTTQRNPKAVHLGIFDDIF